MEPLSEGVMDYVNIMAKQGERVAGADPNSEASMLNRELINFYKNNITKARATIDSAPAGTYASPEHRLHVQAANIAINGYPSVTPQNNNNTAPIDNTTNELDKLKRSGWKPLNEQRGSELLFS